MPRIAAGMSPNARAKWLFVAAVGTLDWVWMNAAGLRFGEGDLAGQLSRFRQELTFADLEIVTTRIARLEDQQRQVQKDIRRFRAGDRLDRDELHGRAVR